MEINIPANFLNAIHSITKMSGETTDEAINSGIRLFVLIHTLPIEDQLEIKAILDKSYDGFEIKGLH